MNGASKRQKPHRNAVHLQVINAQLVGVRKEEKATDERQQLKARTARVMELEEEVRPPPHLAIFPFPHILSGCPEQIDGASKWNTLICAWAIQADSLRSKLLRAHAENTKRERALERRLWEARDALSGCVKIEQQ